MAVDGFFFELKECRHTHAQESIKLASLEIFQFVTVMNMTVRCETIAFDLSYAKNLFSKTNLKLWNVTWPCGSASYAFMVLHLVLECAPLTVPLR